jgi:mono/diheme cytochrome c family protein
MNDCSQLNTPGQTEENMSERHLLSRCIGLIAVFVLLVPLVSACSSGAKTTEAESAEQPARPSNAGGPGEAINLTGDPKAGAEIFSSTCAVCHGDQGKGGVENPGSTDGTVPALNPIDPTLKSSDYKTFATNLDLFIEHGSTPEGPGPQRSMLPFGDSKTLTPQQIADVIAYIISLNQ